MPSSSSIAAPHLPPSVVPQKGMTSGLLRLLGSVQQGKIPRPGDNKSPVDGKDLPPLHEARGHVATALAEHHEVPPPAPLAGLHSRPPSSSPFAVASLGDPTPSLSPFAQDPVPKRRSAGQSESNGDRMSFEDIMKGQPLDATSQALTGLDNVRQHLFGKYHQETEARMKELRVAMDGGISRAHQAALDRVDELSAAMHRDMVALRQELQNELEDLKRDVFSAVMSLSAINDKLGLTDSRARETAKAISQTLADRVDQQNQAFKTALIEVHGRMDEMVAHKVNSVLHQAIQDLLRAQPGSH